MRFHVPQFIEVEDKIFGPLTFKQFAYMGGSTGLAYLIYRLLPPFIAYPLALGSIGLGVALAFYKINNRPFVATLEAGFSYALSNKLYIWKKIFSESESEESSVKKIGLRGPTEELPVPKLGGGRLKNMAWDLDVANKTNDSRNTN